MSGQTRISWSRLGAESGAVLVSILLAFAIDAWWDGHQQRGRESDLLLALADDFEASRTLLEERLVLAERMAAGNALLLAMLTGTDPGTPRAVPDSLIMAVIGGPTYEPGTSSLDAALASGEIELLRSAELRTELATWRRLLADTTEDELEARRITNEQVVPELAQSVGLGPYFEGLLVWTGGDPSGAGIVVNDRASGLPAGHAMVRPTTQLEGALAMRGFYVGFAAADLAALHGSLERVIALTRGDRFGGDMDE